MATYYDALNDFYKSNEQERLVSSAQLVYLHLLHINNCHGNSGYVQVSDRELEYRTKLNKNTITTAKRILKNRGLIDFKTNAKKPHEGTIYTLTFFVLGQALGQTTIQTAGQSVGRALSNYPLLNMDKDLRKKNEDPIHSQTRTRDDYEEDILLKYWEDAGGCKLNFMLISRLKNLLTKYGLEKMQTALELANRKTNGNYGFSLEFFENQLFGNNQSQKTNLKGDEKVESDRRAKWAYSD